MKSEASSSVRSLQSQLHIRILRFCTLFLSALLSGGCYTEGNSHFLASGKTEYFLTMDRCSEEAQARYSDGQSKYSGYECRGKFLIFTLEKRDFFNGRIIPHTGK